ncbi:MAG TPA: hypothetical protein VFR35_18800 [Actinoplanes sp.]|nr:hypothetical protein [Actinoplanes sp.]
MDVLSSGPERPAGPSGSRAVDAWRRALARRSRQRGVRRGVAVVAVLVAAGGLGALRSGTDPAVPVSPPAAGAPEVGSLPTPPFDRQPGRVPIPAPTHAGWYVRGTLPPTGPPGRAAAERATQLVLGRFCARPERYALSIAPERSWRSVEVFGFGLDRGGDPPGIRLRLSWTGTSYEWTGAAIDLSIC